MPRENRAKQFMPFASLRGFDREIQAQELTHVSEKWVYEAEQYEAEQAEDW